jgi:predicted nuclease with RNAse H fold
VALRRIAAAADARPLEEANQTLQEVSRIVAADAVKAATRGKTVAIAAAPEASQRLRNACGSIEAAAKAIHRVLPAKCDN